MIHDDLASDGSPVEVFARLPAGPAADYVANAVGRRADILELGCGAGRLTRALRAAGHSVVAVDCSPPMLARVEECAPGAQRVLADAASLELHRRFGGVVLASYLINEPERGPAFLATCARHLAPGGAVVVQRYDPIWARAGWCGTTVSGDVGITVDRLAVDGSRLSMSVTYTVDGRSWHQEVSALLLDDEDLERLAGGVGLVVDTWLDEFRTWARLIARRG